MPGQESDSPEHDQKTDRQDHENVPAVGSQGRERAAVRSHQVKAGVAEGGDGMKDRHPDAGPSIIAAEYRHQGNCPCCFDDQDDLENEPDHPLHSADLEGGDTVLHKVPLPQRKLSSRRYLDKSGNRYQAESSCLDQEQDDCLAKARPRLPGVPDDQAGNTDC